MRLERLDQAPLLFGVEITLDRVGAGKAVHAPHAGGEIDLDLMGEGEASSTVDPFAEDKPDWLQLRDVFPGGSDYMCDRLYTYLVMYNYIGTRCGAGAASGSTSTPSPRPRIAGWCSAPF